MQTKVKSKIGKNVTKTQKCKKYKKMDKKERNRIKLGVWTSLGALVSLLYH